MANSPLHALVFGGSGLAGWGVVNTLLSGYPAPGTFSNVTALVNRPMTVEESFWPVKHDGITFELATGVDLTSGTHEEFNARLKEKVKDLGSVTQVYYFGECYPLIS